MGTEILNGGAARPDLPPQDVVEDLTHVLLPLREEDTHSAAVLKTKVEEVKGDHRL